MGKTGNAAVAKDTEVDEVEEKKQRKDKKKKKKSKEESKTDIENDNNEKGKTGKERNEKEKKREIRIKSRKEGSQWELVTLRKAINALKIKKKKRTRKVQESEGKEEASETKIEDEIPLKKSKRDRKKAKRGEMIESSVDDKADDGKGDEKRWRRSGKKIKKENGSGSGDSCSRRIKTLRLLKNCRNAIGRKPKRRFN
ncbi:hypothetical protein OS493_034691 [Desmophyllum pertusum]|uniref:Uncharacterized protein n=1 Tax=Desmophyllum pertusum TaxID=174260 RepID=A0A9W9Z8N7_9CNID|nr:hypothetical protein OS493_034691 [Desmophyllum pertusum]